MLRRLNNAWFLSVLAVALGVGLWQGPALEPSAQRVPNTALIAAIMFLTALPIDFASQGRGARAFSAVGLAVLLNAVAAPLLGWLACFAAPPHLKVGLMIACASPCTLASAAVWVRRGAGNDAVAILVTLITNLGCFIVMPLWLATVANETLEGGVPNLAPKLLACVVAPIVAAQLLRRVPAIGRWSLRHKPALSVAAQLGVLSMAFIGAIKAGDTIRSLPTAISTADWLLVIAATAGVHTLLLTVGWKGAKALGFAPPESVAVAIAGSQKTLAVGVGIALEFGGLAIFPMIAYHVQQLLIDTVFVDRVREQSREEQLE